jgi:hypothetical protein
MTENIFELSAFIEDHDGRKPLEVQIAPARQAEGGDAYFCRVHAPSIFARDKCIYGVDPEQAATLAIEFIKSILSDKKVISASGQPIQW